MSKSLQITLAIVLFAVASAILYRVYNPAPAQANDQKGALEDMVVRDYGNMVNDQLTVFKYTDASNTCYIAAAGESAGGNLQSVSISCIH